MFHLGHNGSLGEVNGVRVLDKDPRFWGSLVPKAEYLAQFQKTKAWEIYILPHQLRPQALEQLSEAMTILSRHELFKDLEWLSFHFPTKPQTHHLSSEISQEQWRPFYQLLQVLNNFTGADQVNLNFHVLGHMSLPKAWKLDKKHELTATLEAQQKHAKELIRYAYRLRDHLNPKIGLTVENNPPYDNGTHNFHVSGLFPEELRQWQLEGVDLCLDIQHAALVNWYRENYSYDGPIPPMNELRHRGTQAAFAELNARYLHVAGAPNSPESLHVGASLGAPDDDIDWSEWFDLLKSHHSAKAKSRPVIIELVDGHLVENWPACQASTTFLQKIIAR